MSEGRTGVFVGVCGPSGAGKDSVMAFARERLGVEPRIAWVRRVVTRPSDRDSEDHDTMDDAAFRRTEERGGFALSWEAHGLSYGLRASVDAHIARGDIAVANISRAVIPALRARYRRVVVVLVTASPDILAERLAARKRDTDGDLSARLDRRPVAPDRLEDAVEIDNSGALQVAGDAFLDLLRLELSRS